MTPTGLAEATEALKQAARDWVEIYNHPQTPHDLELIRISDVALFTAVRKFVEAENLEDATR